MFEETPPTAAGTPGEFREFLFPDLEDTLAPPSGELEASGKPLSEIAPGVWVTGMPEFDVPSHVLCRLVPGKEPGTYVLEPEPHPGWVRMVDGIGKRLGVYGLSDTTFRRLLWAGLIEHARLAPGVIFVSIESLLEHFRRTRNDCARDKSYWTAERREKWRQVTEAGTNLEA